MITIEQIGGMVTIVVVAMMIVESQDMEWISIIQMIFGGGVVARIV